MLIVLFLSVDDRLTAGGPTTYNFIHVFIPLLFCICIRKLGLPQLLLRPLGTYFCYPLPLYFFLYNIVFPLLPL